MVRRLLWDNKVPGTCVGTRVAAAPGLVPSGAAAGFLGESQGNHSLPCQTRFEQHREGPGSLKLQGRGVGGWGGRKGWNKDKVANTQGQCASEETVDTGREELGHDGP